VCCLKAATTGLEAWHCLLDHEKRCSKRLMPTLHRRPVVIVQVMDAIPNAGESHQSAASQVTVVVRTVASSPITGTPYCTKICPSHLTSQPV